MSQVRSVTVGVWLRQGSRNEASKVNGISHFIEHLVFKGTESRTAREIALAMDSVGGQIDAFTSKEYTCFYAKVLDEHVEETVELLADIVQRPRFDPTELERERQVVLEEIRMVEDAPDELVYDLFAREFYPNHTLGRPIQGTEETVSAMSRRQLQNFFRRAYRPDRMLVAAAGNFKHAKMARMVTRAFGDLSSSPGVERKMTRLRAKYSISKRPRKELEQLHLLMGLPSYPEGTAERYTLYVLNTLLGGTMSSRLFQKIREERGMAYSVYSALNAFSDSGFMAIYAATSPSKGDELIRLVVDELRSLRDDGPTAQELEVAKEHLKGSLMLSLESTASRMSSLARGEIYLGRQQSLAETLRGVSSVSVRKVHDLARRLFGDAHLSLAAVGRVGRLKVKEETLQL
jgi:predicted Zn-dependent peptidase